MLRPVQIRDNRDRRRTPSNPKNMQSQTQNQFIIRNGKKSTSTKSNMSFTSQASINKPYPCDGYILNILQQNERKTNHSMIEGTIKSFTIDTAEHLLAVDEDILLAAIKRQLSFNAQYHESLSKILQTESDSFSQSLQKHRISESLRAKMVDWMLEVFHHYKETCTSATYFRAVNIMDLFLKKTPKSYNDSDLHLIGIASMFLASKIEDIYHISLKDFVIKVGHRKFSEYQIKLVESEILEVLNYKIYFTTHYNLLTYLFFRCFNYNDNPQLQNILETAVYILKMIIHDFKLLQYSTKLLASVALGYALNGFFENYAKTTKIDIEETIQKSQDQLITVSNVNPIHFKECLEKVTQLVNEFTFRFPGLINLERYG